MNHGLLCINDFLNDGVLNVTDEIQRVSHAIFTDMIISNDASIDDVYVLGKRVINV